MLWILWVFVGDAKNSCNSRFGFSADSMTHCYDSSLWLLRTWQGQYESFKSWFDGVTRMKKTKKNRSRYSDYSNDSLVWLIRGMSHQCLPLEGAIDDPIPKMFIRDMIGHDNTVPIHMPVLRNNDVMEHDSFTFAKNVSSFSEPSYFTF